MYSKALTVHFFSLSFSKTYLDPDSEKANNRAVSNDYQAKIMSYGPEDDIRSLPRPPRPLLQHPYVRVAPPSPALSSTDSCEGLPVPLGHDFFQGKMGGHASNSVLTTSHKKT